MTDPLPNYCNQSKNNYDEFAVFSSFEDIFENIKILKISSPENS